MTFTNSFKYRNLSFLVIFITCIFLSTSIFSATKHQGIVGEDGTEIDVTCVFCSPPTYPRNAIRLGREGYVIVVFDVDTDGSVLDPYVVESEPTGVFERAAIKAVRKWLYAPPVFNDVSVKVNEVRAKLSFNLQ